MSIIYTIMGLLTYHLVIMSEQSQNGSPINPITFLKNRPYKAILSLIFASICHTLTEVLLSPEVAPDGLILALMGYLGIDLEVTPQIIDGIYILALFLAGFLPYMLFDRLGRKRMLG